MEISQYKNIKSISPEFKKDVFKVLDVIKSDKLKNKIAKIRIETDKSKRNELKSQLAYVTFSGVFSTRNNNNLIKSSGLACLDFDGCNDLVKLKEEVNKNKYTFASFVSPSGKGLKVLVRIPPVGNNEDYRDYYEEIVKHYHNDFIDESTKDIARACYLSYDPELFLNPDSELFTEKIKRPIKENISEPTNIPIDSENEIIKRLMIWFQKRWSNSNRNNNLYTLARQFNSFGVSKSQCEIELYKYEQTGFKQKEILKLINSAYKNTNEFNTSHFEDQVKVRKIKTLVYSGESEERILKRFPNVKKENLQKEIDKQLKDVDENQFWYYKKNGSIAIAPYRYKCYLNNNNIYKYFPSENEGFIFIKKEGHFIDEISVDRIKDFVLKDLKEKMTFDAWDMMASKTYYFSKEYMSMIETAEIDLSKDTKDYALLYYKNKAVKVTKDKFELIDYENVKGFVWKNRVIDRNIYLDDKSNGDFKTFIWKISGENKEKYYTFKSVLGYLLHSYKNESRNKTIIFNDELISDVPNGGSGKGLFHKALSYMKKLSIIDGKLFDIRNQFLFQTVSTDTQIILFDDVKKGFKFSNLFSLSTGELKIEKKGKDPIIIPFKDSPKITITTNYTIKGEGGSHKRRVFEVEMSAFFNADYTPEDHFNKLLFLDWNESEWMDFDNYMLRSVQFFLKNGLVISDTINLDTRKIIDSTNKDFFTFMEDQTFEGQRFYKTELKDLFIEEYTDYKKPSWFTTTLFNKWVTLYCDYQNYTLKKGKTNGERWFSIGDNYNNSNQENDNDGFL